MKAVILIFLLIITGIGMFQFLKGESLAVEKTDIDSMVKVLERQRIEYCLFSNSAGNKFLVVPKFGGRILAVSVNGENLFWTHPDILKGQGGQRSWISPEGGAKK